MPSATKLLVPCFIPYQPSPTSLRIPPRLYANPGSNFSLIQKRHISLPAESDTLITTTYRCQLERFATRPQTITWTIRFSFICFLTIAPLPPVLTRCQLHGEPASNGMYRGDADRCGGGRGYGNGRLRRRDDAQIRLLIIKHCCVRMCRRGSFLFVANFLCFYRWTPRTNSQGDSCIFDPAFWWRHSTHRLMGTLCCS